MYEYLTYIARFLVLLLILPAHECAHGYAAYKNGDPTAKNLGRLTLNPLKHFDVIGLLSFILVGFGWAKPVPVNPNNYRDYRKGSFWVAVSGVLTNYALAFVFYPLYLLAINFIGINSMFTYFIALVFYCGFALDLSFFAFNLIPVYPLDGFRVVDTFIKQRGEKYRFFVKYGQRVLLGLLILSMIANRIESLYFLDIFGYFMNFAIDIVGYPITAFWNFIFKLFI